MFHLLGESGVSDHGDDDLLHLEKRGKNLMSTSQHLEDWLGVVEKFANRAVGPAVGANIELANDGAPSVHCGLEKHRVETVTTRELEVANIVKNDVPLGLQVELKFRDRGTILGLPKIDEAFDRVVTQEAIVLQLNKQVGVGTGAKKQFEFGIDQSLEFRVDIDGDMRLHCNALK